ncbi:hypothetical protein [Leeuwenhoekiella nanhaiensis]|nr:hypothetical protein [Leeuwenhoekiella nanhaiensis]
MLLLGYSTSQFLDWASTPEVSGQRDTLEMTTDSHFEGAFSATEKSHP